MKRLNSDCLLTLIFKASQTKMCGVFLKALLNMVVYIQSLNSSNVMMAFKSGLIVVKMA